MQNNGFWVAFRPEQDLEGGIQSFDIWVLQATSQPLNISYRYFEGEGSRYARKVQLGKNEKLMLHTITFDQLNNNPWLSFKIWLTQAVEGKANHFDVDLKLKPKTFFRKLTSVDWMEGEVYLFKVFEHFPKDQQLTRDDLKDFKRKFKGAPGKKDRHQFLVEKANMPDFIDLHAEKLFKSTKGKTSREILEKQLDEFQKYLDKAVYHNLDRVYIVHGFGKGKLRSEIHQRLEDYPHVESYNNNYHPRFGYGATEVIFG